MTEGIGAAEFPTAEETERQYLGSELDRLWARGRDVLGCDLAIMGGAMTWVSERNLVAAISNAGGFGVIASGSMSPQLLSTEIDATAALTRRARHDTVVCPRPVRTAKENHMLGAILPGWVRTRPAARTEATVDEPVADARDGATAEPDS